MAKVANVVTRNHACRGFAGRALVPDSLCNELRRSAPATRPQSLVPSFPRTPDLSAAESACDPWKVCMHDLTNLLAYVLSSMGMTVLLVWPQRGPSAWIRERLLRRGLPTFAAEVLDCYICCSFWCGLLLSPLWWAFNHQLWCWTGCLTAPFLFWALLDRGGPPVPPSA